MSDELTERIYSYRLLARLLKAPVDASLSADLAEIEVAGHENNGLASAWKELSEAADDADIEELDDEFHRLFIGIGRGELLPYRSYYETGFLMEKPLAQLREDLLQLGFKRQQDNTEPEDYLSSLFEVMAMLVEEQHVNQYFFLERHIVSWGERFFGDLGMASQSLLYRAVAKLGKEFLRRELNELRHQRHQRKND